MIKAHLKIQPKPDNSLQAQLYNAEYSHVNSHLDLGWESHSPENHVSWRPLEISSKPFEIHLENDEVKGISISENIPDWEANMIKGIVSQFQLKISERSHGEDKKPSDQQGVLYSFALLEDTITGETPTFYKINSLPEYYAKDIPNAEYMLEELERRHGSFFEITKQKNYTLSADLPTYFHGFGGLQHGLPTTNKMGSFFTRNSFSRALISGQLNRYTIHNSYSVHVIAVNPTLTDKQKGSVFSMVNVTLTSSGSPKGKIEDVPSPIRLNSLVYSETKQTQRSSRSARNWSPRLGSFDNDVEVQNVDEGLKRLYTVGNKNINSQLKVEIVQRVRELSKEIAEDIQSPHVMLLKGTMDKYTILNALVQVLNAQELKQIADELYDARQASEREAWKIFRDSVAICGTGPALITIKDWILSSRIDSFEASLVLSAMAKSVRLPTLQYMESFFELVKEQKVLSEWPLNDTAILSFTEFITYLDERQFAAKYPPRTIKQMHLVEAMKVIKTKILPYFAEQLERAISHADAPKIHVYIRALGNIAIPEVLNAFKPYLNGAKQASQYQRLLMVLSMKKLAESYPEQTRVVLMRFFMNAGENQVVRVASVFQIMRTQPPTEVLQNMAAYSNVDKQEHVAAAVKSAIESVAQLEGDEFSQL